MMRWTALVFLPLLVSPIAALQAETPTQEAAPGFEERLKELSDRFRAQQMEAFKAYGEAETEEDKAKALERRPGAEFVVEFRTLAEEAEGTDTAVRAYVWALRLSEDPEERREILAILTNDYLSFEAMEELPSELRYASYELGEEPVVAALRLLFEQSPVRRIQGNALFVLGSVLTESRQAENHAEGRRCFETVIADFADVPYRNGTLKEAAGGYLFEMDHLQIGMPAPDFETVDENGVAWKLSDYRGKVVVIDFWGYW